MPTATRKCTNCKQPFKKSVDGWHRQNPGWFHSQKCWDKYLDKVYEKVRAKRVKQEKREWQERKKRYLGLGHWQGETQKVVNKYIRVRDSNKPCISCGKMDGDLKTNALHGSVWDAGHYRSVGSMASLRYDTRNINKQCRDCNGFKGGRKAEQQTSIIERYGQARLDWLDGPHEPRHYSIADLERIRKIFNRKIRLIEKRRAGQ